MEQPVLQGREAAERHLLAGLAQAPLDRGAGVVAEVVVVALVERFQKERDLDVFSGFVHGAYLGIQTRTRDSSLSTSRGLAM